MIKKLLNKKTGFTLVELLIVISIIGILSSIVYANFGQARAAARDEIRKTELKNLQLAIELYKAQNDRYPASCNGGALWGGAVGTSWECSDGSSEYIVGLVPDYVESLPIDPRNANGISYIYRTTATGSEYKLMAHGGIEVQFITSYDDEFARCNKNNGSGACPDAGPNPRIYAVYSNSATAWSW